MNNNKTLESMSSNNNYKNYFSPYNISIDYISSLQNRSTYGYSLMKTKKSYDNGYRCSLINRSENIVNLLIIPKGYEIKCCHFRENHSRLSPYKYRYRVRAGLFHIHACYKSFDNTEKPYNIVKIGPRKFRKVNKEDFIR